MKNKYKRNLLFTIILIGIINSLFVSNVSGAFDDDLNFVFNEIDYTIVNNTNFGENIFFPEFNVRNKTTINQDNYTSTFDFLDETIGSNPQNFSIDEGGGTATIIKDFNGHNNVFELNDINANPINIYQYFSENRTNGIIEWWCSTTDATLEYSLFLIADGGGACGFRIFTDIFQYLGASWTVVPNSPIPLDNTWYHIKLIFECGNDVLEGLLSDTFKIFINEVEYGPFDFFANKIDIDWVKMNTNAASSGYICYLDALGYSWDVNYTISQNIVNLETTTLNEREVDKYEFSYDDFPTQYAIGYDNPSNWTDIEDGFDDVNIVDAYLIWNRDVYMENLGGNSRTIGIEKEFYINTGIINVSWSYNISNLAALDEIRTEVYSRDDTLLTRIFIQNTQLRYFDGSNEIIIYTGIIENYDYDFNLFINHEYGLSLLDFYFNNTYNNSFIIPLLDYTKEGLGKIQLYIEGNLGATKLYLHNIGVYIEGLSISEELGYLRTNYLDTNIELNKYNLFNIYYNGIARYHITPYTYIPELTNMFRITSIINFSGNTIANTYGLKEPDSISYPTIWLEFYNNLSYTNISIGGIMITQNITEYYPSYDFNNMDGNISYFYVSNNILYFTAYYDNNSLYENMTITIDIKDIQSVNKSVNFRSQYNGIGYAAFSVNFTDNDDLNFLLYPSPRSQNRVLSQLRIINEFNLLVSDNNSNGLTGFTSIGYIKNLQLRYIPNIIFTISTLDLISVMIPIILIFIPSLMLYNGFKSKSIIIPAMILMSVVCLASNIIQSWLFFIIIYSSFIFLITQKKGVEL